MIKYFNLKASTLCASGALLVLGGFMTVNLAGCGGGGGNALAARTPSPVGATFRILQQDGTVSNGGTLTLTRNGQTQTLTADASGLITVPSLTPGTYTATYTAVDSNGTALPATTRTLVVGTTGAQTYTLVQGDTGNGQFTLTGRVLLNPTGANDPDGNTATSNCTSQSVPVTSAVLISVRDLNSDDGSPIIAQVVRPAQPASTATDARGRYTISLPFRPRTFRVEVTAVSGSTAPFAGISATTTFSNNVTTINSVDVCTNINGVIPSPITVIPPTATPIPTTSFTLPPFITATPVPTTTPDATATATATAGADPTATATAGADPTATAGADATSTAGPNATATAIVNTTATANFNLTPTAFPGTTVTAIPGSTAGVGTGSTAVPGVTVGVGTGVTPIGRTKRR